MLVIQHLGSDGDNHRFQVLRASDKKCGAKVTLPSPESFPVEGRPDSNLAADLSWYLEEFLDYPKSPNDQLAARILTARKQWGEHCFTQLFGSDQTRDWYQEFRNRELTERVLKVASDDPHILGWPWEVLEDSESIPVVQNCHLQRQLSELYDPLPLPDKLEAGCIHILLVVARPYGDRDVGYHAVSRPLVQLSQEENSPVTIEVLRPPTFDQLRAVLQERPGYFHIIHFDGHGGYDLEEQESAGDASTQESQMTGYLVFEADQFEHDVVTAVEMAELLAEHRIPIMVLNACRSAQVDEKAEDPFASVATAMMRIGIRSVVAMSYNLWVSGAQRFVPVFYQRLFQTGLVAEAVYAGRQEMYTHPQRACLVGEYPLQDWMVPVLYQQNPIKLTFNRDSNSSSNQNDTPALPEDVQDLGDYGFIGRERMVLKLERAIRSQQQGAILIHGMAGMGKTTLAKGFLQWLRDTAGLQAGAVWISFEGIHSADAVINPLVDMLFGTNAMALPNQEKDRLLAENLNKIPLLVVWDNFESASGIPGTEVNALLSEQDRSRLAGFLHLLRGGRSKVLITSRSEESWLTQQTCYRLSLGGLQGEELWEYCNMVVSDLDLTLDQEDDVYGSIMQILEGHPLAIRAILLRLDQVVDPEELLKELQQGLLTGKVGDKSTHRILQALALFDQGLDAAFAPLLQLIGLHRRFMHLGHLENMIQFIGWNVDATLLDQCIHALQVGGLLHPLGENLYSMHPALAGHLMQCHPADEEARRGFVGVMGGIANDVTPKQIYEQKPIFHLFGASFHLALAHAKALKAHVAVGAIIQFLATFAQNNLEYDSATQLFEELADYEKAQGREKEAAVFYHQLGLIAGEKRDYQSAEQWYNKSLAIKERLGNEHGAAKTYHQLGIIAEKQRDYPNAELWYKISLEITKRLGIEQHTAQTYLHLGKIDQHRHNYPKAEQWYKRSLEITERLRIDHITTQAYHQLGRIAERQHDYPSAEQWYNKSLAIKERSGDEHGAAKTYHHLGIVAEEQRNYPRAEQWYKKSLEIEERVGDEHGAATTYHHLGRLHHSQGDLTTAAHWQIKAVSGFANKNDERSLGIARRGFIFSLYKAKEPARSQILTAWEQAGLGQLASREQLLDAMQQLDEKPP